jgi:hypothetical protein
VREVRDQESGHPALRLEAVLMLKTQLPFLRLPWTFHRLLFITGQTLVLSIVIIVLRFDGTHGGHVPCGLTAYGSPGGPFQRAAWKLPLPPRSIEMPRQDAPRGRLDLGGGECHLDMSAMLSPKDVARPHSVRVPSAHGRNEKRPCASFR